MMRTPDHASTRKGTRRFAGVPGIAWLSWQQARQSWLLLGIIWLALLILVTLVSLEPLLGRVTAYARYLDLARSSAGGANFSITGNFSSLTPGQVQQVHHQLNQLVHQDLGQYAGDADHFTLSVPWMVLPPAPGHSGSRSGGTSTTLNFLAVSGQDLSAAARQISLLQGRLPRGNATNPLEVAIPTETAQDLHLAVGSELTVAELDGTTSVPLHLTVVGIFAINPVSSDFWGNTVRQLGSHGQNGTIFTNSLAYHALTSSDALLAAAENVHLPLVQISWQFPVSLAHLDSGSLNTFLTRLDTLIISVQTNGSQFQGVGNLLVSGTPFTTALNALPSVLLFEQVLTFLLLMLTMALALMMIGSMSQVLIDRRAAVIATLRSRGATQGQIFWMYLSQGLVLLALAMVAGPVLAVGLIHIIVQAFLPAADAGAASIFDQNWGEVVQLVCWYVLFATTIAFLTLFTALRNATRLTIVTLRRETARPSSVPYWKRFYLDVALAVLIWLSYVAYTTSFSSPQSSDFLVQELQVNYAFVSVPFILVAVLLLSLRCLPLILRLLTRVASRLGSPPAYLALAQIERSPRAISRLLLLFVLALSTSFYLLGLLTTQQQFAQEQITAQVGADFAGSIPPEIESSSFAQLQHSYSAVPGITSVTLGYRQIGVSQENAPHSASYLDLSYVAVDANTYASTATWPGDASQTSLADLMRQLKARRADAGSADEVPALVDAQTWLTLDLKPGQVFSLTVDPTTGQIMKFVALAEIQYVPGISAGSAVDLGLLTDYQSFAAVYARDARTAAHAGETAQRSPGVTLAPDTVFLRTKDDAASLSRVRAAFPDFRDRRAELAALQVDPAHVNLTCIFVMVIVGVLSLALLGSLMVSWANLAIRGTIFALMSALGMTSRQVAAMLMWEYGAVYTLALLLGLGLGKLFSYDVVPAVRLFNQTIYGTLATTTTFAITSIFPWTLAALLVVGLFGMHALLVMGGQLLVRQKKDQVLRLNED